MTNEFQPRNDLEKKLLDVHEGRVAVDVFMKDLLIAEVFMPVSDGEEGEAATPMALQAEDGTHVMILFSSPERAKSFTQDFPGFEGGFLLEFSESLGKIGADYGIAINPGWDIGIDIDADTIRQLVAEKEKQDKLKINVIQPSH